MRRMAAAGTPPAQIARRLCRPPAEVVVRLVELELGALGRVRPLPPRPARAPFGDGGTPPPDDGARQAPMLRLAARALAPSLQRLGDRLFVDGAETDLRTVVELARARGEPIRYPGIDPMPGTFAAGPSVRRGRGGGIEAMLSGLRP